MMIRPCHWGPAFACLSNVSQYTGYNHIMLTRVPWLDVILTYHGHIDLKLVSRQAQLQELKLQHQAADACWLFIWTLLLRCLGHDKCQVTSPPNRHMQTAKTASLAGQNAFPFV